MALMPRRERLGQLHKLLAERDNLEKNITNARLLAEKLPGWEARLATVDAAIDQLMPERREAEIATPVR